MVANASAVLIAASTLLGSCSGFAIGGRSDRLRASSLRAASKDVEADALGRRELLDNLFRAAVSSVAFSAAVPSAALALDFDAFESSVISKDTSSANPELTDDEALCKFGAPGKAMGEACKRAGMKPNLPSVVDASGKVDRGDYLKCVYEYPVIDGKYVKTRVCKPSSEWGPP